jgi:hypothetical protein
MPRRSVSAFLLLAITALVALWSGPSVRAQATPAAIAGRVSSADAGAMEGVYISAKMTGSPITVSVMTDSAGRYTFPRSRLAPGTYAISIRAIGYELDNTGPVTVTADKPAQRDLTLHKASDVSLQMSSAEWLMSFPGHRSAEAAAAELPDVPHAGADRAVAVYGGTVAAHPAADGKLRDDHDTAAARRCGRSVRRTGRGRAMK